MRIDHYFHNAFDPGDQAKLNRIYRIARGITAKIDAALSTSTAPSGTRKYEGDFDMARTIEETLEAVTAASSRTDSLIAYVASIKQQLDDALANVKLPAAVQEKIDAIFDIETADAAKIDTALNVNVPPPPVV